MDKKEEAQKLLSSINNLHTTELGVVRIRRNLGIEIVDIIGWCKEQILSKAYELYIRTIQPRGPQMGPLFLHFLFTKNS